MQPASNDVALNWPFARTCEKFMRVEFDLGAQLGGGTGSPDGTISLLFSPLASKIGTGSGAETEPWAAIRITWDHTTGATAEILSREAKAFGQIQVVGSSFSIGGFTPGVMRTFRVDFGWDYFRFPQDWVPFPPGTNTGGLPWADLRISEKVGSNWVRLFSLPPPPPARTWSVSNGWVEFGTTQKPLNNYGALDPRTTGFDYYDWPSLSGSRSVYVHWHCDQGGNVNAASTWLVDNVTIAQVAGDSSPSPPFPDLQPFTLMSNQLGYDTAGPQWVVMRPNDTDVRALGQNAIADLTWTLRDASGTPQRTFTTSAYPPGEPCFSEVVDYEGFNLTNGTYPTAPVFWWRWEWIGVTNPQVGWYVTADGHLTTGSPPTPFHVQSDPFTIDTDLYYSTLVADPNKNLATKNAADREAVDTNWSNGPTNGDPGGGWFDAGNENGENRSQGTFVSALCNLLRRRRPHLSTAEARELIRQI